MVLKKPSAIFDEIRKGLSQNTILDKRYNSDFVASYYYSTFKGSLNLMLKDDAACVMAKDVFDVLRQDYFA